MSVRSHPYTVLLAASVLAATAACAPEAERHALAEAPRAIGMCASCHGPTGRSALKGTPHIAGQDEEYLVLDASVPRRAAAAPRDAGGDGLAFGARDSRARPLVRGAKPLPGRGRRMNAPVIAASILAADFARLGEEAERVPPPAPIGSIST